MTDARDGVAAVVPLFNPPASASAGIRALAGQVASLLLVDDGSPQDVRPFVEELGAANVRLIRSSQNLGIAHALNLGVAEALRDGRIEYVLTADQDSTLSPDYVDQALAAVDALRADGVPFAAVTAGVVDDKPNPGVPLQGLPFLTTTETIQSGMLLPVESLRDLGQFDETFFIDCVDTDYILRGAGRGLPTVLVPGCAMQHAVGEGIAVRLPFPFRRRDRVVPYHGPVRRYYIMRNRVRLVGRHARHNPRWALVQSYEQTRSAVADLVFGDDRAALARAMVHGVLDGLRSRGGRIPERLEERLATGPSRSAVLPQADVTGDAAPSPSMPRRED